MVVPTSPLGQTSYENSPHKTAARFVAPSSSSHAAMGELQRPFWCQFAVP